MNGRPQKQLEATLEHRFKRPELLKRALTHSSALPELELGESSAGNDPQELGNNERLEFLGDSVLGLLASEFLVRQFPNWNEGSLSKGRARLVNERSLQSAARSLSLGEYLRLGRGEEKTGGREKPAVLADAVEAVVAALYLDGGLEPARRFLNRCVFEPAIREDAGWLGQIDHKSALQEFLQARQEAPAIYHVVSERGPHHRKVFRVEAKTKGRTVAVAEGHTKKDAEQSAARLALKKLSGPHTAE